MGHKKARANSGARIAESYAILLGLNATLFVIGEMPRQLRDFKSWGHDPDNFTPFFPTFR